MGWSKTSKLPLILKKSFVEQALVIPVLKAKHKVSIFEISKFLVDTIDCLIHSINTFAVTALQLGPTT